MWRDIPFILHTTCFSKKIRFWTWLILVLTPQVNTPFEWWRNLHLNQKSSEVFTFCFFYSRCNPVKESPGIWFHVFWHGIGNNVLEEEWHDMLICALDRRLGVGSIPGRGGALPPPSSRLRSLWQSFQAGWTVGPIWVLLQGNPANLGQWTLERRAHHIPMAMLRSVSGVPAERADWEFGQYTSSSWVFWVEVQNFQNHQPG